MKHQNSAGSGIIADKFHDKHPQERMNLALKALQDATDLYMVEVIAKSH
jgi:hypothetical protein